MSIKENISVVAFILLWEMYYLQNAIGFQGGVSQGVLVVLLTISIFYFYKVNSTLHTSNYGIKAINIVLFLAIFYGFIHILNGENATVYGKGYSSINRFYYLKNYLISLLPIYFYYYKLRSKDLNNKLILFVILSFLLTYIVLFYYNLTTITIEEGEEEITNNAGYYFLSLVPLLYLIRENALFKLFIMGTITFFIIMSLKRGAMIVGGISLVFFLYNNYKHSTNRSRLIVIILTVILLAIMYNFVIDFYNSSDYFQARYNQTIEGDTSKRAVIYSKLTHGYLEQDSIIALLFGNGADSTLRLYGAYAHNDWLEFLTNEGMLGVIVYFIYWYYLFKYWKKTTGNIRLALGSLLFIYFTISFFSMSINDYSPCVSLCLGYCLASSSQKTQVKGNTFK